MCIDERARELEPVIGPEFSWISSNHYLERFFFLEFEKNKMCQILKSFENYNKSTCCGNVGATGDNSLTDACQVPKIFIII